MSYSRRYQVHHLTTCLLLRGVMKMMIRYLMEGGQSSGHYRVRGQSSADTPEITQDTWKRPSLGTRPPQYVTPPALSSAHSPRYTPR
ncbi:hypothetical protein SRHO_G00048990 [Serrasalmus rhombeus]